MNTLFASLRHAIDTHTYELNRAKEQLADALRNHTHEWSNPIADHIYEKAYTIPGDPPGTMGVDWRGPTYVEARTIKRWKRVCPVCGEMEYTSKVIQQVTEEPTF